jgi:hypothetical protein
VIFERFRQANKTMADRPGGTGLGLAISRQIVEFFGGRIWVDSAAGTGTRIIFEIPAAPVQGARALAPAVPAQSAE